MLGTVHGAGSPRARYFHAIGCAPRFQTDRVWTYDRSHELRSMIIADTAARYAPYVLGILRIMVALLFLEHGTSKLFGWPSAGSMPAPFSLLWFAGIIELIAGTVLALGLFTRPAALIM